MAVEMVTVPGQLLAELRVVVGARGLLTDPDLTRPFAVDWTGRFQGRTPAVVRPATTEEVAGVLAACNQAGVSVVPQGGNTGLVGGSVPLDGEIVLSLRRLVSVSDVDRDARVVLAGAGVTLAELREHAHRAGLEYPVDLAARESATVGGMVATNAGGLHFLRYGGTREQLAGIEAVLADGSVVRHTLGLAKDNTGYDLTRLLCGSEGTLGVVTAAQLRLVPPRPERVVALAGFASVEDAVQAALRWRDATDILEAVELLLRPGLELVCSRFGLPDPLPEPTPAYLLVEAADRVDPTRELSYLVERLNPPVCGVAVATEAARRQQLWAYRELHTEAIAELGPVHKLDVALPAASLARFIAVVSEAVNAVRPDACTWLFGHVADGNIHVNVTGVAPGDESVDDAVFELVASVGGSISAEHGIGVAKRRWLHLVRTQAEIETFRRLKAAFDPKGILNPNVLLPPKG
ncbi:MAG: FAD-binding oxidoreductase [Acidimicrobiales bacterium]|nr:FAD-binding oxidoreductase [Acidimicrobiales bacterium]